ncbi:MAG: hypothetical protein ACRCR3_08145 [Tannerellaceae bacterium]
MENIKVIRLKMDWYIQCIKELLIQNKEQFGLTENEINESAEIADRILDLAIGLQSQFDSGVKTQNQINNEFVYEVVKVLSEYASHESLVRTMHNMSYEDFICLLEIEKYRFVTRFSIDVASLITK